MYLTPTTHPRLVSTRPFLQLFYFSSSTDYIPSPPLISPPVLLPLKSSSYPRRRSTRPIGFPLVTPLPLSWQVHSAKGKQASSVLGLLLKRVFWLSIASAIPSSRSYSDSTPLRRSSHPIPCLFRCAVLFPFLLDSSFRPYQSSTKSPARPQTCRT